MSNMFVYIDTINLLLIIHLVLDGFEGASYKRLHEVRFFGGVPISI